MAKVYAFTADGMEEVECLAVCDILRRAGVDTKLVSVMGRKEIVGSHGFKIEADCLFEEISDDADVLFLPGGLKGTENLKAHEGLAEMLKAHAAAGKRLAVICAENIEKQTLAAQNEGQRHPVEKPGRMPERSGHQKSIPPREIEAVGIGAFARENVVVREHHPLGASFRA